MGLFAASVGLLIQIISSRFRGIAGVLLRIAAGVTWSVATYFVVPVLLYEPLPTWGSLKRSAGLFANSFGRTAISNLFLGLITIGFVAVGVVVLVVGLVLAFGSALVIGIPLILLAVLIFVAVAVVVTAASGVLRAALYRYATTGRITPGLLPPSVGYGRPAPGAPLPSTDLPPGY